MRKLVGEVSGIKIYSDDDPFYADKVVIDGGLIGESRFSSEPTPDGVRLRMTSRVHPEKVAIIHLRKDDEPGGN